MAEVGDRGRDERLVSGEYALVLHPQSTGRRVRDWFAARRARISFLADGHRMVDQPMFIDVGTDASGWRRYTNDWFEYVTSLRCLPCNSVQQRSAVRWKSAVWCFRVLVSAREVFVRSRRMESGAPPSFDRCGGAPIHNARDCSLLHVNWCSNETYVLLKPVATTPCL